jgi:3-hydroxyisobutyrate dehydrogenase-like beta-hydroxyacid dehydrogenase
MSEKPRVGFIGVGLMGHGAARHILERGKYALTILGHRNREPVDDLVRRGAREAENAAALVEASDIVLTCLPSSVEFERLFLGDSGIARSARPGMVFVDLTTNDPAVTRKVGAALADRGAGLVDAALGRTPKEAEEGRLSTYVGGDPALIEKVRPILSSYADTIVVCGPLGAGTTCKLVNNSITIGTLALLAEGFATAAKLGVDIDALAQVLSAGGANSPMWRVVEPWIRAGDDSHLKGTLWTGAKDLRTYGRMAEGAGVAASTARAANQTLQLALDHGHGGRFLPVLPGILAELNGAKIRDIGNSGTSNR